VGRSVPVWCLFRSAAGANKALPPHSLTLLTKHDDLPRQARDKRKGNSTTDTGVSSRCRASACTPTASRWRSTRSARACVLRSRTPTAITTTRASSAAWTRARPSLPARAAMWRTRPAAPKTSTGCRALRCGGTLRPRWCRAMAASCHVTQTPTARRASGAVRQVRKRVFLRCHCIFYKH
jgi:hypothetical protein